jgi:gas vesicle protein
MTQETLVALFGGGVIGAAVSGLFNFLLARKQMTLTNEEALRKELQEQIDALKLEIQELRSEVGHWRDKYFEIYEEHVKLKVKLGE